MENYPNSGIDSPAPALLQREVEAANDPFARDLSQPKALGDLTAVAATCRQMLDAPADLPVLDLALEGLALAIEALAERLPTVDALARAVRDVRPTAHLSIADGATLMAFSRRHQKHALYLLAVRTAHAVPKGPVDRAVLALTGARYVLRIFRDVFPACTATSNATAAIAEPNSPQAVQWSAKARARALVVALRALNDAIATTSSVARAYGLSPAVIGVVPSTDPIEVFNRRFRRRLENLLDYATLDQIAGAGGHGTLSPDSLERAGAMLLSMVRARDTAAALVCIEVITHLTSEIALRLPTQLGDEPPQGALAWLDVPAGTYCQVLFKVVERGARPEDGTELLYEVTTQVVVVTLTPPLAELLRSLARPLGSGVTDLEALLGDVGHHPRSAVVGDGIYRITARRLQESLPAMLLAKGHHRWLVAITTNSYCLVSRGRPVYGACRAKHVDAVVQETCEGLSWPVPRFEGRDDLIGSFTTPTNGSVRALFAFLCTAADEAVFTRCVDDVVTRINRHAQWLAALLAFAFALRRWLEYCIDGEELRAGHGATVDDKDVHALKGVAIPVVGVVRDTMVCWCDLLDDSARILREIGGERAVALAGRLESWVAAGRRNPPAFTVNAVDELEAVGYLTWWAVLPRTLRLRSSFGRQFWPLHLLDRGIEQLLTDVLTRHQVEALYIGSEHRLDVVHLALDRLRAAMEATIADLRLRVPVALRRSAP